MKEGFLAKSTTVLTNARKYPICIRVDMFSIQITGDQTPPQLKNCNRYNELSAKDKTPIVHKYNRCYQRNIGHSVTTQNVVEGDRELGHKHQPIIY